MSKWICPDPECRKTITAPSEPALEKQKQAHIEICHPEEVKILPDPRENLPVMDTETEPLPEPESEPVLSPRDPAIDQLIATVEQIKTASATLAGQLVGIQQNFTDFQNQLPDQMDKQIVFRGDQIVAQLAEQVEARIQAAVQAATQGGQGGQGGQPASNPQGGGQRMNPLELIQAAKDLGIIGNPNPAGSLQGLVETLKPLGDLFKTLDEIRGTGTGHQAAPSGQQFWFDRGWRAHEEASAGKHPFAEESRQPSSPESRGEASQ